MQNILFHLEIPHSTEAKDSNFHFPGVLRKVQVKHMPELMDFDAWQAKSLFEIRFINFVGPSIIQQTLKSHKAKAVEAVHTEHKNNLNMGLLWEKRKRKTVTFFGLGSDF